MRAVNILLAGTALSFGSVAAAQAPQPIYPRVLQIAYNPILENQGGVRLHSWAGWNSPGVLRIQYVLDMKSATHDIVQFRVNHFFHSDVFPLKVDGFRYDDASYVAAATSGTWHQPDGVDYRAVARNLDLARRVDSGEIDEVFMDGAPFFGYWESTMAGNGGYWCNSPPQSRIPCSRIFVIMGFNYERGVAEMLHSCGHRSESIMEHTYGFWDITQARHDWERFTHNIGQSPDAACGSVHYPPNGLADYDYANPAAVVSTAVDWTNNFPNLTGQTSMVGRETWGGPDYHRNFMKWWYGHMPHLAGRNNHDGFDRLNNWYAYIFDLNRYPESGGSHAPGGAPPLAEPNVSTVVRLTNDALDAWAPQINGAGRVVWHGFDGLDFEIYSANEDGTDLVQITSNTFVDEHAQINASGRIVWQVFDGSDFEIFSADSDGSGLVQITNNAVNDWHPQINDSGRIVWDQFDGSDYEIMSANADGTDLIQVTSNNAVTGLPRDDVWPRINNAGRVAWFGYDGADWEVFSANQDGTGLVNVSNDAREDVYPRINNLGRVVWYRHYSDTNTEICSADATGGPVVRITNNSQPDWHPEISDSGTVVWMGLVPFADWEVYSANAADGSQLNVVSDNAGHDQYPRIDSNGVIVWQGFDGNDWEIYGLQGGTIYQLTDNDYDDRWASIAGRGRAAWHGHGAVDGLGADSTEIYAAPVGEYFDDVDDDGLPDDWEMYYFGDLTRTAAGDEEPDGLTNAQEWQYETDPTDADTDDDGLPDGYEILTFNTDPLNPDSDGDGLNDGAEDAAGTDPNDPDSDDDQMDDAWEVANGLNPLVDDADDDPDNDMYDNLSEYQANSDPMAPWSIPTSPPMGTALEFDGSDDFVNLGNVAVSGTQLTVEAWVKPAAAGSARILEKLEDYGVQFTSGNVVRFLTRYGFTWDVLDGATQSLADEWVHVACVLNGTTKYIYVNGQADASKAYTQQIKVTANDLIAGASSPAGGQGYLSGTIDEVRVWNIARTATELQTTMTTPLSGSEPGLLAYWRFDDGSGQSAWDELAGFHGTLGSSPSADSADPQWVDSPIAVDPQAGQGPQINQVDHPAVVGRYQSAPITANIVDTSTGNEGVAAATLFYGYGFPYNDFSVAGVAPIRTGDGTWTFDLPAQGDARDGQVLSFFIRAEDGAGNTTFDSNNEALYAVTVGLAGDWDGDGDVDLGDFAEMPSCFEGPEVPPAGLGCEVFDTDGDTDVDLADYATLTRQFVN